MYHALINNKDNTISNIHVLVDSFTTQMEWLKKEGYETLDTSSFIQELKHPLKTGKKVLITFDDGYYSLLKHATPVFLKHGFKATLFLTTSPVGKSSYEVLPNFDKSYPPLDRPLNWEELLLMEKQCWDIQAHGHRHLPHNMITEEELISEIEECKREISLKIKKTPMFYSFPYGRYNTRAMAIIKDKGFKASFSVHPGFSTFNSDTRRLQRIEITVDDTLDSFITKITTGYSNKSSEIKSRITYNILYRNTFVKDFIKNVKDKLSK